MTTHTEVSGEELADAIGEVLAPGLAATTGGRPADVALAARWLVQAESLGLHGFGIDMMLRDLDRLPPRVSPPAQLSSPASAVNSIDATGIPGPLALALAVRRAGEAGAQHGVGIVGVRNVGALGVLGFGARHLAGAGYVALLAAQAPAMVAPWGGTAPAIGTNPLAIAAPRANAAPLVADFATAPLTLAELREYRSSGASLPDGVALDAAGVATTDAARVAALLPESLLGSLGGFLVELLAGVAVGGRTAVGEAAQGRGALVLALDPAAAGGAETAVDTAQLAEDWRAAGGHVPQRFDHLPVDATATAALPRHVRVSAASYAALRAAGAQS